MINALPTPPSPSDNPADFNTKAFNLLGALPTFVSQANAQALAINDTTRGGRNRLINGCFRVAQRGSAFTSVAPVAGANNDDTYVLDRWFVLADGNDIIDVTQSSDAPTGGYRSMALDVETVAKKFGIAQIVEGANCAGLIGSQVTLSFKVKASSVAKLDNLKAAIIAWSGTEDVVTSDVVSAWNAEGVNPTLIANATYENTPANLGVSTSWTTKSVSATVDTAGAKNLVVLIWSDVTDTTLGDFLYIADVQLEVGSNATEFERRDVGVELGLCQRYYQACGAVGWTGRAGTTSQFDIAGNLPVVMRSAPTGALLLTAFQLRVNGVNTAVSGASIVSANSRSSGAFLVLTVSGTPLTAGGMIQTNETGGEILAFVAEL